MSVKAIPAIKPRSIKSNIFIFRRSFLSAERLSSNSALFVVGSEIAQFLGERSDPWYLQKPALNGIDDSHDSNHGCQKKSRLPKKRTEEHDYLEKEKQHTLFAVLERESVRVFSLNIGDKTEKWHIGKNGEAASFIDLIFVEWFARSKRCISFAGSEPSFAGKIPYETEVISQSMSLRSARGIPLPD